ncbi:MAG: hypothetical protein ACXABD_15480 [Candidatus Thorarchaeota archaeon]
MRSFVGLDKTNVRFFRQRDYVDAQQARGNYQFNAWAKTWNEFTDWAFQYFREDERKRMGDVTR